MYVKHGHESSQTFGPENVNMKIYENRFPPNDYNENG